MSAHGPFSGFGRSLLFAAATGLCAPFAIAFLRPWVGGGHALALLGIAATAFYAAGLSARRAHGVAAAAAILAIGCSALAAGAGVSESFLVTAAALGALRSGWLQAPTEAYEGFARRFAREVVLLGSGLAAAAIASSGHFFPISLGLWAFFLVQSGFFLLPPRRQCGSAPSTQPGDPFERASARARRLLESEPAL